MAYIHLPMNQSVSCGLPDDSTLSGSLVDACTIFSCSFVYNFFKLVIARFSCNIINKWLILLTLFSFFRHRLQVVS